MGLTTSLNTAVAGLNATQLGIGVVSQNVANADKPGYIRRQVSTVDTVSANMVGVGTSSVQRLLDSIVQRQLWQETSAAAYTSTRSDALSAMDRLYGQPGSSTALDTIYNGFTSSLQALQNDPSNYNLRSSVLDSAGQLARQLNTLSEGVQSLRTQAESGIANAVTQVNSLLNSLTSINARIVGAPQDGSTAELKDERDRIVANLSQFVDIRTNEDAQGSLTIATASGTQLFDGRPSVTLSFDARSSIGPGSQWSANSADRSVGTITLTDSSGNTSDAIANKTFRSGTIAGYLDLRDKTLVQAQSQLDEIAAQMSSALSDREVAGTAATSGAQAGFAVDLTGLQSGNAITLDYKANGGATQRFTFVRVESGASLPLPASAGGDANNRVIGIDFSGGTASVASQIQAAVGSAFTVSGAGSTLTVLDDGAAGTRDVVGLTARPTNTTLSSAGGATELPFFVDGGRSNAAFTGSYENGSQTVGFASRIIVNPLLVADRTKLVAYDTTTAVGDAKRPQLMLSRLTDSQRAFTNATGLGGSTATTSMSVSAFVQRAVASQGQTTETAQRLNEGQQVALASVQSRFQTTSKVTVDQEMASLIELQTAYAANARIISTVKEMMDVLMRV